MTISPRYLILTVLLLATLVGLYMFLDARRTRLELEREVQERSSALLWTLLTSSRNATAGSNLVEGSIRQRLLDNAHLVDQLLAAGGLNASQLDRIVVRNHLQRIEFLDRRGQKLSEIPSQRSEVRRPAPPQGAMGMKSVPPVGPGRAQGEMENSAGAGLKEQTSLEANEFRVAIPAASFPGFIAVHADGRMLLQFRDRMGIQGLLEELGERPDVAYVALVDSTGRVVAHSDPSRVGKQPAHGSPGSEESEGKTPDRVVRADMSEVHEVVTPFPLGKDRSGELRLGLSVGPIRTIWAQDRRNAAIYTGSILLVGILGVLAIVLNQRRYLQSVQALQEKAQRDQRLAALGNLAAGVAHEIRNPLNALAMGLHRLLREWRLAPGEDQAEFARLGQVLQGEVARLNDIIERFLQLARPAQLTLSTCPLEKHLGELLALVREQAAAESIAIEAELTLDGVTARLDCGQVHQAFLNLVVNAFQAMPHGGKLHFTARRVDRQFEVAITDTGVGISPEHLDRIFEPYFTTKEGGTGLGLALAQRIIDAHGGTISVESRPGTGSTFRVRLPLDGPSEAPRD
ncbi:MAG TPA: ATP-binding protein [Candidatus Methylomirabilis sp.]|nr:ATP-binding protein [Candidatus Methylomirabilis sp.]